MNFEVYCDESGLEALTRKDAHNFTAIGGIWMPAEFRANFKTDINAIKGKHNVKGSYVIIIVFVGFLKANFVTAYEKNDMSKILNAYDFERNEKYFGKDKA